MKYSNINLHTLLILFYTHLTHIMNDTFVQNYYSFSFRKIVMFKCFVSIVKPSFFLFVFFVCVFLSSLDLLLESSCSFPKHVILTSTYIVGNQCMRP